MDCKKLLIVILLCFSLSLAATPHRSHIRTFINWGSPDEFVADNFDAYIGKGTNMNTLNPNGINFKYTFFGFVDGWEKTLLLPDYAAEHGLTDKDIENMYIHAKEDVYYTLGAPKELDPKVTKLVKGWDPANDLNDDHHIDDNEYANRVNTMASARYKSDARIPIYYWGPPTDWQIYPGDPNYQEFILWYFNTIVEGYDGLYIDTMHLAPTLQGDTIVTEYPDLEEYANDVKGLLTRVANNLPGEKPLIGNGWYANYRVSPNPYITDGSQYENWERIITKIPALKLDRVYEIDNMGKMQLIQHLPIYHETANPSRPEWEVSGISLERDQIYGLSLYYLVHGDYTYFGYGCHGSYPLGPERWFDAINYDVGQPLGSYYIFDDSSEQTNIIVNGDFETDDGSGNPASWEANEPVELDSTVKYSGTYSAKIHSTSMENNNINRQTVTLKPNTYYTLSVWIKTDNVVSTHSGANIYPYGFDDIQEYDNWPGAKGTTDWTFYTMSFKTGSDVEGRINYRIMYGTGTAWFDDFHLAEGLHNRIYGRDFENALVLNNPEYNYEESLTTTNTLDGNYRPLKADGTLEAAVTSISLEDGQGAILIKEESTPLPPECTSGETRACTTSEDCPGTETCTNEQWGACIDNPDDNCPIIPPCINGETQDCTTSENCPGKQTCNNNAWSFCIDNPGDNCPPVPGTTPEIEETKTAGFDYVLIVMIIALLMVFAFVILAIKYTFRSY